MALNASQRCDRCGAQAYVEVDLGLLFCAHHWREHGAAVLAKGLLVIQDDTHLLREPVPATLSRPAGVTETPRPPPGTNQPHHLEERPVTIYVTEPKKRAKNGTSSMTKPVPMHPSYQPGGTLFETGDIVNLMADYPEAIYYSDNPDVDFGLAVINLEDYRLVAQEGTAALRFYHVPSGETLLETTDVSLETLVWRAEQHHAGVKDPRR